MKQLLPFLLIVLLLPFAYLPAQQQKEDTLQYQYPTEIIINASRLSAPVKELPFSTSVVGSDVIKQIPRSVSIDEPLKLVPGVKIDNQANGSRVHLSIRGQGILTERGIRGIKILYDEIPLNDPTGFAPDFFDIDYSRLDRIEVLRGPAASLYGGSASGGIINLTSQNSINKPLYGEASLSMGSNNFWKGFGQFGGKTDKMNYDISFSRMMGDGYREHTHFWGDNVYGKAIYTPSDNISLTPIFGWTDVYHENPEGVNLAQYAQDPKQPNPDAIPFNEYLETNRVTNGLKGLIIVAPQHELQFNGYVKRTLFTEANNHTFNHRTIVTPGTSLQYSYKIGQPDDEIRNVISAGTDLQWQTIDEHRVDNLHAHEGDTVRSQEEIKQRGAGFFLLDKINVGKDWTFHVNLRYDDIHNELTDQLPSVYDLSGSADFTKFTARLGATYSVAPEANLFASWGQGFLPPATEELAQNPDHFGGFNTHLESATSNSFEAGSRGNLLKELYYDVTGFYMTTEHDFDRYRITDPLRNQETFYRNAGSSRRYGAELFGKYSPIEQLDIQLAYTYSNFTYTNGDQTRIMMDDPNDVRYILDGNWLPNSPEHQLCVDVQYQVVPELTLGLTSETLSKAYIDGANKESEVAEGYTLFHGRAIYNWNCCGVQGELSFNVRNIGDTKYVAFIEPDPGGNSYQPGSGQEFFGGLKIRF